MRHDNTQRRVAGRRPPRSRILVISCGAKTEKRYLDGLRRGYGGARLTIRPVVGSPVELVKHAKKVRSLCPDEFDDVWCVFDSDHYIGDNLDRAVQDARRARISLAVSNPRFEYWLLLHFAKHEGYLHNADEAGRMLLRYLPTYDKTKLNFDDFAAGVGDAVERGRDLAADGRDHRHCPSTMMWRLAEVVTRPA